MDQLKPKNKVWWEKWLEEVSERALLAALRVRYMCFHIDSASFSGVGLSATTDGMP
jgi:hypothetical protein